VGGGIYREGGKDECDPGCSLRGGVLGLYERALLFHHSSVVGNSGGSLEIPLSPDALDEVVKDCLAEQDEIIFRDGVEQLEHFEDFTIVRGLVTAFALHKERLEVHRPLVIYWLGLLSNGLSCRYHSWLTGLSGVSRRMLTFSWSSGWVWTWCTLCFHEHWIRLWSAVFLTSSLRYHDCRIHGYPGRDGNDAASKDPAYS